VQGVRCTGCAARKKACNLVADAKASLARVREPSIEIGSGEDEVVEVDEGKTETPKKKGIFSAFTNRKRTQADRSPEESSHSEKPRHRFKLVGVDIPPPPIPHSHYQQLGSRLSPPSSATVPPEESAPPLSSSPSLASFDSAGSESGRLYEVERLKLLLNASQESLRLQRQQYEASERQMEQERALYERRIRELEGNPKGEGGSGYRR
jgi:hypothetical protein